MKRKRLTKLLKPLSLLTLLIISGPSLAQSKPATTTPTTDSQRTDDAASWLKKLNLALTQLNFDGSFVLINPFKTEPYRWRHGLIDGIELEQLSRLNGSGNETVRRGDLVSYFEPATVPYSLRSDFISGPIPEIFYQDSSRLTQNYDLVMQGRERIAGRLAQQIRIQPKYKNRYSYTLSLDAETGMLLKFTTLTPNGAQIEDLQVTSMQITQQADKHLLNIVNADLPEATFVPKSSPKFNWQIDWVPEGFSYFSGNRHRLTISRQLVEQQLFSDGIVNFSVYLARTPQISQESKAYQQGATSIVQAGVGNYELTVIGKIPLQTASQIAQSVVLQIK